MTELSDLQTKAADHLWMHFARQSALEAGQTPIIVKGEGHRIFDDAGRSYIDGLAGLFVVAAGHGRESIAEAAARQAKELAFFPLWSYATPPAIDLAERALAAEYITRMRVRTPSAEQIVGTLSGGNQQKVVLARWLSAHPGVVLMDEPTRGIDVGAKYEIYGIIQRLASEGKGVIVVSSELPELLGLSDRIYTIFEGSITGEVAREDASQEALMKLMTASRKSA